MTDAKLDLVEQSGGVKYYDMSFTDGDFTLEEGLDTAMIMSILCEVRDESITVPENRSGWWGSTMNDIEDYEQGSLVWTKYQAAIEEDTLQDTDSFANEGLQWFIDDKIASEVTTKIFELDGIITSQISISRNNNTEDAKFFELWNYTGD